MKTDTICLYFNSLCVVYIVVCYNDTISQWSSCTSHFRDNVTVGKYHLHLMEECVSSLPVSLGLARNSALTARVGVVLRQAVEMGLVAKWLRDTTHNSHTTDESLESSQKQTALASLPKLAGGFVALAVGCGMGVVVLLCEIAYFKYQAHRKLKARMEKKNVPPSIKVDNKSNK